MNDQWRKFSSLLYEVSVGGRVEIGGCVRASSSLQVRRRGRRLVVRLAAKNVVFFVATQGLGEGGGLTHAKFQRLKSLRIASQGLQEFVQTRAHAYTQNTGTRVCDDRQNLQCF